MKKLQKRFNEMFFENKPFKTEVAPIKTGVVYHEDMLEHKWSSDYETQMDVDECPQRLESILNQCQRDFQSSKIEILDELEEVDWQLVEKVHGKEYVDKLKNLWPEETDLEAIEENSTYYCEGTTRAAKLAAQATVKASEKIINKEWKNAFCLVRPPGHHANSKPCSLKGFCIINNVAVAAQYLQDKFDVQKIAILDWDVHHGDSTQQIFYDSDKVLYVSIHRFLNGKFYPGESGSHHNLGTGKGYGYNLNLPLNNEDEQYVGDSDYIYAFERAIFPVLKKFNPQFVFISCGFDCLYGDPLGKLSVSRDGLMYILNVINQKITTNINVVLEGGYKFEQVAKSAQGILSILSGASFPNPLMQVQITQKTFFDYMTPQTHFIIDTEEAVQQWQKFWPILNDEKYLKVKNKVYHTIAQGTEFVAGHWENMRVENEIFYKKLKIGEVEFFQKIYHTIPELKEFLPKIYGVEYDQLANAFLKQENLEHDGNYNSMDFKIADVSQEKYKTNPIWNQYFIYFTGYKIVNEQGSSIEKLRSYYLYQQKKKIFKIFFKIFHGTSQTERVDIIREIIKFVKKLLVFIKEHQLIFSQASVLILYDCWQKKLKINLIDFAHSTHGSPSMTQISLEGLLRFFKDLKIFMKQHPELLHENEPIKKANQFRIINCMYDLIINLVQQMSENPKTNQENNQPKKKKVSVEFLNQINAKIVQLNDALKQKNEEIKNLEKKFDYEKEGLEDRNQQLQILLDKTKEKYEKNRKLIINTNYENAEMKTEVKQVQEEIEFYKNEAKEKFQLEIQLTEYKKKSEELEKFKKQWNQEQLMIQLKDLQSKNQNILKQNEILKSKFQKLEKNSQNYLKLLEENEKKYQQFQKQNENYTIIVKDQEQQINSLQNNERDLQQKLQDCQQDLNNLNKKFNKQSRTNKKEIDNLLQQNEELQKINQRYKKEIDESILSLRKNPQSSQDTNTNQNQKIILQTVVSRKKELEKQVQKLTKTNRKLMTKNETFESILKEKDEKLNQLFQHICSTKNINSEKQTEEQKQLINNWKYNVSIEEMRDMIEKLLIENIELKNSVKNN